MFFKFINGAFHVENLYNNFLEDFPKVTFHLFLVNLFFLYSLIAIIEIKLSINNQFQRSQIEYLGYTFNSRSFILYNEGSSAVLHVKSPCMSKGLGENGFIFSLTLSLNPKLWIKLDRVQFCVILLGLGFGRSL